MWLDKRQWIFSKQHNVLPALCIKPWYPLSSLKKDFDASSSQSIVTLVLTKTYLHVSIKLLQQQWPKMYNAVDKNSIVNFGKGLCDEGSTVFFFCQVRWRLRRHRNIISCYIDDDGGESLELEWPCCCEAYRDGAVAMIGCQTWHKLRMIWWDY